MPMNVDTRGLDEGGDEPTRRIAFQPSFEPISSFEPPSLKESPAIRSSNPSKVELQVQPGKPNGTWKLSSVPVLPKYHPIEQTAVFVPHTPASEVSLRISDVLRERSIEACFDDAKAKASCVTADGVDFRVRLYNGRGEFGHGIIVEVQRRFGTSTTFYHDTKAILDAAEGKIPPPPSALSSGALPMVEDECDESTVSPASSLGMVSEMLNNPGQDTTYLALQMLVSLTDSTKMGTRTAEAISSELLRLNDSNEVAGNVFSLLMDESSDGDVYKLRTLTFQAVANAFQAVNGDVSSVLKEQLVDLVSGALRQAEKSPRIAYQAARMAIYFRNSELQSPLKNALEVGKMRHSALERQAQLCLGNSS